MSLRPVKSNDRKRTVLVSFGIFALFSILIIQFFNIQIIEGDRWTRVAYGQHYFLVREPFMRGTFYSNTDLKKGHPEPSQPFVIDIQKFHLYIDPASFPAEERQPVAQILSSFLEEDRQEILNQFQYKSRSRKASMWLDEETRSKIQSWWSPYARTHHLPPNAIYFVPDYQRSYPFGNMLGQVLHTIQSNKDEVTKQGFPTGGLELQLNPYLKGKLGKRLLMRSPRNAFEMGEIIESPQDGADVYLTINHFLQGIAEEEIEKGVKTSNAKSGWVVVMDPHTGEILALAQYPPFFPANYQEYFNDPLKAGDAIVKAVTDANEPGSCMKPITLAIALKANQALEARGERPLFSPDEKIAVADGHFPGRSKPIVDTHKNDKYLNMNMGLQHSSNIYMARLMERTVNRLGSHWYRAELTNTFALGKKTGLELPAESAGVVPTPGKTHPNGALEWSVPTPFSLAMGHNIQTTSIQMLRAHAVLANGGYLVQPTLIRKIVKKQADGSQEILVDNTSEERLESFPQVLDPEIVDQVVSAMRYYMKKGGRSARGNVNGFTCAGKTGSARKIVDGQYSTKKTFSSFIGFVPIEKPAFVILVAMDEPEAKFIPGVGPNNHGGVCAAPVFREVAARSLQYLGVTPDDPYALEGGPLYDPSKALWTKEVRELAELHKEWNH